MNSNALDELLSVVEDPSSRTLTLAAAEPGAVFQARRVTENDWRLTLEGGLSLADRLEAVVHDAPDAAQGTFRIVGQVGPTGRHPVQLEIGCRGPHLVSSLLEAFVDDHAGRHSYVRLSATLQVDDSMRPRRVDVLVPSGAIPQVRALPGMLELAAAQPG